MGTRWGHLWGYGDPPRDGWGHAGTLLGGVGGGLGPILGIFMVTVGDILETHWGDTLGDKLGTLGDI